ncbi:hypothetical protein [Microbacterium sp.]|uniref:hypothetical protein n=1 Tax=Microbacterium sp. TaxID=51671 RepID=UPI0028128E66|nr:hypothetical protein [Microbacterium sp.]
MSAPERHTRQTDARRVVFEFDQAVDRIGEEAAFQALGPHRQAARYLAEAHRMLDDVRAVMHRIDAGSHDPMLRPSAQRRMHAVAVEIARAGMRDAERVKLTAQRLTSQIVAPDAIRSGSMKGVIVGPLRDGATKITAWSVEKWTGSPVVAAQLPSTTVATTSTAKAERITRHGQVPARRMNATSARAWRRVGLASAVTTGGALAAYGGWTLLAQLFF